MGVRELLARPLLWICPQLWFSFPPCAHQLCPLPHVGWGRVFLGLAE